MKIVIVDDEPKIRNGLSKLLSSRPGFDITAYSKMPWKRWNSCLFLMRM